MEEITEFKDGDEVLIKATVSSNRPAFFPGYTYDNGHSIYRGEDVGEGEYVYAEPGIYNNIALLDSDFDQKFFKVVWTD